MAEGYQCSITINNRTAFDLRVQKQDLAFGVFKAGPSNVPKKATAIGFVATGTPYLPLVGSEGAVIYQIGDDANTTVTIAWDIPASQPSNKVIVDTSNQDIAAQLNGFVGSGDAETCTLTVVDGR